MLKQRVITALILLPLALALFFFAPLPLFASAAHLVIVAMAYEWAGLAWPGSKLARIVYALVVGVIPIIIWRAEPLLQFWPSASWPASIESTLPMLGLAAALLAWPLIWLWMWFHPNSKALDKNAWVKAIAGVVVLIGAWITFVAIRAHNFDFDPMRGGGLILMMFAIVWGADVGAYFAGKQFGKTKLAPIMSPNKTWEGVAGGMLLGLLVAYAGVWLLHLTISSHGLFALCVAILVLISVLGDLFESMLKRLAGVKDSSQMLPGHGGLLDRLDSTIAVAPFFFVSLTLLDLL